jgi:hypothetical protein
MPEEPLWTSATFGARPPAPTLGDLIELYNQILRSQAQPNTLIMSLEMARAVGFVCRLCDGTKEIEGIGGRTMPCPMENHL